MKNEKKNSRVEIALDKLKIGDIVTIAEEGSDTYTVLDVGNPFILIENNETHFAYLYRPNKLYKTN